ncbi:MAG: M1 family peptidase, partial [Sphingobacteriales bacterium]
MLALLVFCISSAMLHAQQYWQQEVNYNIAVALNDQQHSLKGNIKFEYINHSPDELSFIWIHLWPNGYKDKETALYKQVAADKEGRKRLKDFKEKGFIDSLAFTVGGIACKTEAHPQYQDIVKLILPKPLQ